MQQGMQEHERRAARIETLIQEVAAFSDPNARATTEELIQALMDMYGEGLARLLEITAQSEASGLALIEMFANDELLSALFMLHGLHPLGLETRVLQALDEVRPYLQSHGGNVELVGIEGNVAHLRLQGSCHGCPSSTMTLKMAIEEAIYKAAPDLDAIHVEGVIPLPARQGIPMTFVAPRKRKDNGDSTKQGKAWQVVEDVETLPAGALKAITLQDQSLLFCRIAENYYVYHNRCANCHMPLDRGTITATALTCAQCGQAYDVSRAGRGLDDSHLFLEPVPLLIEDDRVKVALAALSKDDQSEATLSTPAR
ncbi:MAG TPA: NifU family protein [Ktedonobacteraceae bacterium]|jgi:Fe-S cluster biogenesis protein NfuA/nitrite reductase/ring-hydroxylating ferredoxin subunit|nr:NifU family protein [Ktedonobacteraceae bacterium]